MTLQKELANYARRCCQPHVLEEHRVQVGEGDTGLAMLGLAKLIDMLEAHQQLTLEELNLLQRASSSVAELESWPKELKQMQMN